MVLLLGTTDARRPERLRKIFARALVDGRRLYVRNLGPLREAVEDEASELSHIPHGQVEQAIAGARDLEHRQRFGQLKNEGAKRVNDLTRLWSQTDGDDRLQRPAEQSMVDGSMKPG